MAVYLVHCYSVEAPNMVKCAVSTHKKVVNNGILKPALGSSLGFPGAI